MRMHNGALEAMLSKSAPYDTIDDILDVKVHQPTTILPALYSVLIGPYAKSLCGVLVNGQACLPSSSEWGRKVFVSTGETLQVRVYPRGACARR